MAAIDTFTTSNHEILFPLAGGGLCPGDTIRVDADGVWLADVTRVASFDQNGDLMVNHTDVASVESKLGTADPTADFDGDELVTAQDLAILKLHLGHHAPDTVAGVPVAPVAFVSLSAPMPNPFQRETWFTLTLAEAARVDVALFDVTGRRVAIVFGGEMELGSHPLVWNGRGSDGMSLMSGIYFLNAVAGPNRIWRRAVFLGGR